MNSFDGDPDDVLDEQSIGLLDRIRDLYTEIDPMPAHLVEHARFAVELDTIEIELARRGSDLEPAGAASRGVEEVRHITFEGDSLTILIAIDVNDNGTRQVDGWLTPAAAHRVEIRTRAGVLATRSDERGRFMIDAIPEGAVQLVVHAGDAAVTSPVIVV